MKIFLPIVILGMSLLTDCYSQSASAKAIANQYDFSNVVVADSLSKEFLFHNAIHWVNNLKEEKTQLSQNDSILGKIEGESSYFVYTQGAGILKKLSGRVTYKISIEVKENKYRYHFSDFVFHYYKQNRTYNMAETGMVKPLNDPKASGWQKLWDSHRSTTMTKMKEHSKQLELKIIEKPALPSEKITAKKVEW